MVQKADDDVKNDFYLEAFLSRIYQSYTAVMYIYHLHGSRVGACVVLYETRSITYV